MHIVNDYHGESCPDCFENQCLQCMEMNECDGCGELLCYINGCFMNYEMDRCY